MKLVKNFLQAVGRDILFGFLVDERYLHAPMAKGIPWLRRWRIFTADSVVSTSWCRLNSVERTVRFAGCAQQGAPRSKALNGQGYEQFL